MNVRLLLVAALASMAGGCLVQPADSDPAEPVGAERPLLLDSREALQGAIAAPAPAPATPAATTTRAHPGSTPVMVAGPTPDPWHGAAGGPTPDPWDPGGPAQSGSGSEGSSSSGSSSGSSTGTGSDGTNHSSTTTH